MYDEVGNTKTVTAESIKMELTVLGSDGRNHQLDVTIDGPGKAPHIEYMGNNLLLDAQVRKIADALARANTGLI